MSDIPAAGNPASGTPEECLTAIAVAIHRATCPLRDDPDHECARAAQFPDVLRVARDALAAAAPLIAAAERERIAELAVKVRATYPFFSAPGFITDERPFADLLTGEASRD
jgi:hypothetical protein